MKEKKLRLLFCCAHFFTLWTCFFLSLLMFTSYYTTPPTHTPAPIHALSLVDASVMPLSSLQGLRCHAVLLQALQTVSSDSASLFSTHNATFLSQQQLQPKPEGEVDNREDCTALILGLEFLFTGSNWPLFF